MADKRPALNRERVIDAALELADKNGIDVLSMRRIGKALGVEGMALYNHVANKDEILDGITERVLAKIPNPSSDGEWKDEMRDRTLAAREVFLQHSWAVGLLETRHANSSATRLSYYDAVLACLGAAGFSPTLAMRSFSLLDSFLFGSVVQELSLPFDDDAGLEEVGEDLLRQMADAYPSLTEATTVAMAQGWDNSQQFEFGLDLILDALGRLRDS